jgi:hypothetical protein
MSQVGQFFDSSSKIELGFRPFVEVLEACAQKDVRSQRGQYISRSYKSAESEKNESD